MLTVALASFADGNRSIGTGFVGFVQRICDAACSVNLKILMLCHGGSIVHPSDEQYVLSRTKEFHGFFGESSMERLSVEIALQENAAEFKRLKLR